MISIADMFELDECVEWIRKHKFDKVAIQIPQNLLNKSTSIVAHLRKAQPQLDSFVIVSQSCSPDYVSPQHLGVGHIQALVRIGRTCLAPPPPTVPVLPTFFAFSKTSSLSFNQYVQSTLFSDNEQLAGCTLVLFDTDHANLVQETLSAKHDGHFELARLIKYCEEWKFSSASAKVIANSSQNQTNCFGSFMFEKPLNEYERIVFVGNQVPLQCRVLATPAVWHLDPVELTFERIASDKELRKRVALIEKAKKCRHFGFVLTHAYPNADEHFELIERFQQQSKKHRKFKSTVISLVQTTDECKLGNFDTIDSFVIINNCFCSSLIDRLKMHVPLLNLNEFRISRGESLRYGAIDWNSNDSLSQDEQDSDDDESDEDADNKQLIVRNFDRQTWFGLQVNAGQDLPSDLQQGLSGIASGYQTEPVFK